MDFEKRCQWCGRPFIAHKMTTLYCSKSCLDKAYKAKKKDKLLEQVDEKSTSSIPKIDSIGDKPYLTPIDVSILLDVSLATINRYMAEGTIKAYKFKQRTRIRRSDLESIFENMQYKKRSYRKKQISDTYTMKDITEKYNGKLTIIGDEKKP